MNFTISQAGQIIYKIAPGCIFDTFEAYSGKCSDRHVSSNFCNQLSSLSHFAFPQWSWVTSLSEKKESHSFYLVLRDLSSCRLPSIDSSASPCWYSLDQKMHCNNGSFNWLTF